MHCGLRPRSNAYCRGAWRSTRVGRGDETDRLAGNGEEKVTPEMQLEREAIQRWHTVIESGLTLWMEAGGAQMEPQLEEALSKLLNYMKAKQLPLRAAMIGLGLTLLYSVLEADMAALNREAAH